MNINNLIDMLSNDNKDNFQKTSNEYLPQMTLYSIHNKFFNTLEETELFVLKNNINYKSINLVQYFRFLFNKYDVIKVTKSSGEYDIYSAADVNGYNVYQSNKWQYVEGDISNLYAEFRNRGILFKYDVYADVYADSNKHKSLHKNF